MYCQLRMKFNLGRACLDIHQTMRIINSVTATVTWTGHGQWQGQDMGWGQVWMGLLFSRHRSVGITIQYSFVYPQHIFFNIYFFDFFLFYCLSYGVLKTWLFRTGRHEDKEEIE